MGKKILDRGKGLDLDALADRILSVEAVPDDVFAEVANALGASDRNDAARVIRSEPQAGKIALAIIGPEASEEKEGEEPVAPSVAERMYGPRKRGKSRAMQF